MTNNSSPRVVRHRGLTLLELSVVITILLLLVSLLFIGSRAWRRGSDRSTCVMTLRNVQVATRSYQNIYGYSYGGHPYAENGTQAIYEHLFSKGYIETKLYKQALGQAPCPAGGTYTCPVPDVFPEAGELYMECSLSGSDQHAPATHADW
jgi:prepilin-type N-terminal cleavage/methylation domain-containing protein